MTIDGKLYHVSKNGYAIDRYAKGLHEIDGGMYYVKEDGSFLTNSAVEYLTFDANGRYTLKCYTNVVTVVANKI